MTSLDEYTESTYLNYMHDIGQYPVLSHEQEILLIGQIRAGDKQAYEYFCHCNLKLAVSIAKKYINKGVPLMDLIQAANEGLMRAVDKFDHTKGFKFSTYATWWIHQAVSRLLRQKGLVHVPEYIVAKLHKIRMIEMQLGEAATDENVASAMQITVERLHELRRFAMKPISFEALTSEEDDECSLHLESVLSDERDSQEMQRTSEQHELRAEIEKALALLTTRERAIVKLRYGLDDEGGKTLQAAGTAYGISRERVRQIEVKALEKLQPLLKGAVARMGAGA